MNDYDMVRVGKSKEAVDLVPNTIRGYHREGLPLYKIGKTCFFSRSELRDFIKRNAVFYKKQDEAA